MDLPKASVVSAPRGIWDLLLTDADHKSSLKSAAIFIILWNRTFKRQRQTAFLPSINQLSEGKMAFGSLIGRSQVCQPVRKSSTQK